MPGEVRRRAKAINFGIIYGISAFGLANQLGIAREEAGAYIKKYFERFPGIRDYMEATKKAARANGYRHHALRPQVPLSAHQRLEPVRARLQRARRDQRADPGLGRRHHPPRDDAHGRRARRAPGLSATMLLQVHDELVFEAPDDEVEATLPVVTQGDGRGARARGQAARAAAGRRARGAKLGGGALGPSAPARPLHDLHRRALPRARSRPPLPGRSGAGGACPEARCARRAAQGLSRRAEAKRVREAHGAQGRRAAARALRPWRGRPRQDHADGHVLRRGRNAAQASGAFSRLHGRRSRPAAPLAPGAEARRGRRRRPDRAGRDGRWRARLRYYASTSFRCATSPMR